MVEVDGRPTPKVIDFGVAKDTEQRLTDQSFGDTGAIVGTPTYMSPKQADPSSIDWIVMKALQKNRNRPLRDRERVRGRHSAVPGQ